MTVIEPAKMRFEDIGKSLRLFLLKLIRQYITEHLNDREMGGLLKSMPFEMREEAMINLLNYGMLKFFVYSGDIGLMMYCRTRRSYRIL